MIPKRFELFGQTWKVKKMSEAVHEAGTQEGVCDNTEKTIHLYTKDRSEQHVQQVFWHEAVHAILDNTGNEKLSKNEGLVDLLGHCIHQILNTKKGKF